MDSEKGSKGIEMLLLRAWLAEISGCVASCQRTVERGNEKG
jgi:hypothetical protein